MNSKNKPELKGNIEKQVDIAVREEIYNMVDKLNQASLELFPTMLAAYYLNRDGREIVNAVLTEEQHESIRKLTGI